MEVSRYQESLVTVDDDLIQRDVCNNTDTFVERIVQVFHSIFHRHPKRATQTSTSLQGNICEFCVWELGNEHWKLYRKEFSWPTNASKPWRPNSDSGVDIIAIDDNADSVYVIEVKSTRGGGSSFIEGDGSTLEQDFKHLFEKPRTAPENRIWGSIDEATSYLSIHGHAELADKVVAAVGDNAAKSKGIRLVGVLVCKKGQTVKSHNARKKHFRALQDWLLSEGWRENQYEFRTVELEDFEVWYTSVLQKVAE